MSWLPPPTIIAQLGADLRHLQHARAVGRLHGLDGAEGLRLHPGPQRPEPRRLRRLAAAVRRRHQAALQGAAAAEGGRRAPLRDRAGHLDDGGALPRSRSSRSAPRRRSSACSTSRFRCRSPTSTSRVLVIFAITSMGIYGIVLAGWSSNSKYSLLGGLRSSAQMISYELSYGLALAAVIMMAGSLSLREIVMNQSGTGGDSSRSWYIFLQPLGFFIYMMRRRRRDQPRAVRLSRKRSRSSSPAITPSTAR